MEAIRLERSCVNAEVCLHVAQQYCSFFRSLDGLASDCSKILPSSSSLSNESTRSVGRRFLLKATASSSKDSYEGLEGFGASITKKNEVKPVFFKPRKVP